MLLLALILYYASAYNSGIAAPVISSIDSDDASMALPRDADNPALCLRKRTEIIWSCISTILAASWVSVHPNLPHPKDSKVKKTLRRIELMLWAIITPEFIIFWAMRQWYGARTMEREFLEYKKEQDDAITEPKPHALRANAQEEAPGEITSLDVTAGQGGAEVNVNHTSLSAARNANFSNFKWTRTHGFFLQMGGFVLLEGKRKHILGWRPLMEYYKAGQIDLSNITEARINDHSKADGFAKGLALLQICWFIIQCIARFSDHHLVLTELELVTAALAVLSLFMYCLWWNKPFNAEIPIVITLSSSQIDSSNNGFNNKDESHRLSLKSMLGIFKHIWNRILDEMLVAHEVKWNLPMSRYEVMKVPTFYSLHIRSHLDFLRMILSSFSIAALFGAIHCAGWSSKFLFSSHINSLLWRVSSSIITGSPLIWCLVYVFGHVHEQFEFRSFPYEVFNMLEVVFALLSGPTIPLYIVSRIILLILAFVELRDLPPGALAPIQWANFVPFIH